MGGIGSAFLKATANGAKVATHWRDKRLPAAREEGLLVEAVGDETVVYDAKSKEAHCLGPLAAVVFANCDGHTTIERLASLSAEHLGEPVEVGNVLDALAQLEERELMAVPAKPRGGGLSRRDLMRTSAGVAAGALITTVVAPNTAAAQTATCANLLCCPCCQNEALNKEECCTIPNVTNSCQCTGNRDFDYGGGGTAPTDAKFCKPSGTGAPSDEFCIMLFGSNSQAETTCTEVEGFPEAGFDNCLNCTEPN